MCQCIEMRGFSVQNQHSPQLQLSSLKKTLPDALTMLQDSWRKCQASQKKEEQRWRRSPWWLWIKERTVNIPGEHKTSFLIQSVNCKWAPYLRDLTQNNRVGMLKVWAATESWLTAVKTHLTADKQAHSDAFRDNFSPDVSLLKRRIHTATGISHSHISNTEQQRRNQFRPSFFIPTHPSWHTQTKQIQMAVSDLSTWV